MAELFLIRHGETAWNREQVFRGRRDVQLSRRGREQAQLLAEAMSAQQLEAVYSSPLARARETAGPLAQALGLTVVIDERLVDMSFGEWEGMPRVQVAERWPELYETWLRHPDGFRAPGGEGLTDVAARARPALEEIAARHGEASAAIVSHRVVCKVLLCSVLGVGEAGFWQVKVDTGSVSLLRRKRGEWAVVRVNDAHHMEGLGERAPVDF